MNQGSGASVAGVHGPRRFLLDTHPPPSIPESLCQFFNDIVRVWLARFARGWFVAFLRQIQLFLINVARCFHISR